MKTEPIKHFMYVRKSSEGEDRQVQSIPDQIRLLTKRAEDLGIRVIEIIEESKSAKSPYARPLFTRMVERIEEGEAEGILCWEFNRLSRNSVDSGKLQWLLQQGTLKSILTVSREYKPDDNALLLSVESGSANQFILDLKKGVRRGLNSKLEKGDAPIMAPLGYENTKIEVRGENYIIVDPERFSIVRRIWDLMLTGSYTPPQILELANNEWGLRTRKTKRKGGKPISRSTIYRILTDPFYAGLFVYRGETHQGNHTPMITLDEFDRVQLLLGREGRPRPKTHLFAYTGIMRCGECDSAITATERIKFNKEENRLKTYSYYHCTRRKQGTNCSQRKYIPVENLEEQIERKIMGMTILPEFKDWALEILKAEHGQETEDRTKLYESQQSALTELFKQLDRVVDLHIRELIEEAEYIKRRKELKEKITLLEAKLSDTSSRAKEWIDLTERTFNFACYAHLNFLNGDLQTKKEILTALGQNFVLKDGEILISPNSWFVPLIEIYPEIEAEYKRSEPTKDVGSATYSSTLDALRPVMRARPDLNRQPPP